MDRREALKKTSLLMGGALTITASSSILQGCQPSTSLDWLPLALTENQANIVAEIAEIIIPATDTPGAKDTLVHRFIDLYIHDVSSSEEKDDFINGIEEVNKKATEKHGKDFMSLSSAERVTLIQAIDDDAFAPNAARDHFFRKFKELSLLGYFTSEAGASQALEYLPVPGRFEGCSPLKEGQKAWAI